MLRLYLQQIVCEPRHRICTALKTLFVRIRAVLCNQISIFFLRVSAWFLAGITMGGDINHEAIIRLAAVSLEELADAAVELVSVEWLEMRGFATPFDQV